jgi:type II secretory pathway pseudopilin PulG
MTLIEVLVSLTILLVVGLGAVQLLVFSMRLNSLASQRSVATGLASERIQQLVSQRYQGVANYLNYKLPYETASAGPPPTFLSDYGQLPGYPDYRRMVVLAYDSPVAGMLRIQCKVSWRSVWQGTKEHEMVVFLHPKFAQR